MTTDSERMDFLERVADCVKIRAIGEYDQSPVYPGIELFTIPSQHIRARNLREAIDKAIINPKGGD